MDLGLRSLGVACILLVGACSSGSAKTATSTVRGTAAAIRVSATEAEIAAGAVRDACSLLTTAELQAALGGTAASGSLTTAPETSEAICEWTITLQSGSGFGAELHTYPASTDADFTQARQAASGTTNDIAGIGDKAYSERVVSGGQVFDDLWVREGAISFRIEVLSDIGSKPLVQLAQAVIARL